MLFSLDWSCIASKSIGGVAFTTPNSWLRDRSLQSVAVYNFVIEWLALCHCPDKNQIR